MAHGHAQSSEIRNPGTAQISGGLQGLFFLFIVIGVASFAMTVGGNPARAWSSFLINHFYFMSLAIGGLFIAVTQWASNAMWSAPLRRLAESFASFLPIALITTALLYFGMHHLYIWTDLTHVAGSAVLKGKSGYLSIGPFIIRNVLIVALWIFFAYKMIGGSIAQDKDRDIRHTLRNRVLGPIFLILFALTYTIASFDQMMSLDPYWFSTIFGVYCFAGLFYSALAALCILTVGLKNSGKLEGIVNDNHLHDIGKFMFAFTIFWAYIGFAQFLLIWYANLPEETRYYIHRFQGGWLYVSIFLLVGKFFTPFFLLLPRDAKRNSRMLVIVAVFMLFAQWIDVLWMVQPQFSTEGPQIGFSEIGLFLGFLGMFGIMVSRFLAKNNVVAIGDPRLAESVLHHHQ